MQVFFSQFTLKMSCEAKSSHESYIGRLSDTIYDMHMGKYYYDALTEHSPTNFEISVQEEWKKITQIKRIGFMALFVYSSRCLMHFRCSRNSARDNTRVLLFVSFFVWPCISDHTNLSSTNKRYNVYAIRENAIRGGELRCLQ